MHIVAVVVAVLGLLAVPASAAQIDPAELVLHRADVPAGFDLDREETGLRSNELEAREHPETRKPFARWRRVTGYQTAYQRSGKRFSTIEARVDVFRETDGARRLLAWVDLEYRKAGINGLKRAPASLGAGGWVFWSPTSLPYAVVIWREHRVFSGVFSFDLGRERTLALARVQQRRIAAAVR
jgi:hypothetical protein